MNVANLCELINTEKDLNEKSTVKFELGRQIGSKEAAFCQQHFVDCDKTLKRT
jgi:hypothetical protein